MLLLQYKRRTVVKQRLKIIRYLFGPTVDQHVTVFSQWGTYLITTTLLQSTWTLTLTMVNFASYNLWADPLRAPSVPRNGIMTQAMTIRAIGKARDLRRINGAMAGIELRSQRISSRWDRKSSWLSSSKCCGGMRHCPALRTCILVYSTAPPCWSMFFPSFCFGV